METRQLRLDLVQADFRHIAGIDEAGRGCLAGPVVAAAVILPDSISLPGLADSKQLSERARETLEILIKKGAIAWGLGVVWPRRIEAVNILNATLEAMARAAASLSVAPDLLLIDGNCRIRQAIMDNIWQRRRKQPKQRTIVAGDKTERSISAASIIAKTYRDRLMAALGRKYPIYGFEKHKGYGTRAHMSVLASVGPCPMHRRNFRGVPIQEPLPL